MLFHTWPFLFFFAIVFIGLWPLTRTRFWLYWLLTASYVFYGWWSPYYLILIFYSSLLDYWVVNRMDRCPAESHRARRLFWLWVSIVNNLALLGFFKYSAFFVENANVAMASFGSSIRFTDPAKQLPFGFDYALPVGISFYTFQSMSYTIDFYRGQVARESSFIRFATYVAFFPQLVAGPIERSSNLLPQLHHRPRFRWNNIADGASLFLIGMFKKVAIANFAGAYVDRVYRSPADFGPAELLTATFCFAWQIYCDFSGYSDMARGIARMMGFNLMLNFRNPYVATNLRDFWARWHISLSTWFRDYVYLPLGGNRKGRARTQLNLLLVFVISGFWHGAAWQFIIWGALHGVGIIATRAVENLQWYQSTPAWLKRMCVFAFVCITWVFFRAESVNDAWLILRRISQGTWQDPRCPVLLLCLMIGIWAYQYVCESDWRKALEHRALKITLATAMVLYLMLASSGGGEFIYFQF